MTTTRKRAAAKPPASGPTSPEDDLREALAGVTIVRMDPKVPRDDLQPYHKNPRRGDIPAIRQSVATNGFVDPCLVNIGTHTGRENEILGGNHRWAATQPGGTVKVPRTVDGHREYVEVTWPGLAHVPCSFVDVTDARAAKIVVALNRLADKATNDADVLKDLLVDMDDLVGSGYVDEDLAKMLGGSDTPDTSPMLGETGYALIIDCEDEDVQAELLEEFEGRGLAVRPLMM